MFNTVGVFGKYKDAGARDAVSGLVKYLSERDIEVWIGPWTAEALLVDPELAARVSGEDIFSRIDLGIVLGGDGTLLHVARDLASQKVPVIGNQYGQVGFPDGYPVEQYVFRYRQYP